MFTIRKFPFDADGQAASAKAEGARDWPVIYLLNNDTDIYVGETDCFDRRFGEHLRDRSMKAARFTEIRFAYDGTENRSAVLDYEFGLVRLFAADGKFNRVVGAHPGTVQEVGYHQRARYGRKMPILWNQLHALKLTRQDWRTVSNTTLYKYSPLTSLTTEQMDVMSDILEDFVESLSSAKKGGALITGGAGTGKSLLAIKAIDLLLNADRYLADWKQSPGAYGKRWCTILKRLEALIEVNGPLKIAYIAPQQSFNADMQKTFSQMSWEGGRDLVHNTSSIVSRYDSLEPFDIILVDETHRLKHRTGMGNDIGLFDENCRRLGLPAGSTQLDVILSRTRYCCLFHDPVQTVRNSDITPEELERSTGTLERPLLRRALSIQKRCLGGGDWEKFLDDVLSGNPEPHPFGNYDFRVYDDAAEMVDDIRRLDGQYGLCRNVAGFAWPWKTKAFIRDNRATLASMGGPNHGRNVANLLKLDRYDISIGKGRFIWNIKSKGWVTSPGAVDEIGCIHTSQGYDLNYCGVILGPDIRYNPESGKIEFDPASFCDPFLRQYGKSISPDDLCRYIGNAYRTMLLRGIYGCFVYAVDDNLRAFLKQCESFVKKSGWNNELPAEPSNECPPCKGTADVPATDSGQDPDKWIGKRIVALRKAQGLSQEELAFRSGINRSYMGVIERGEKSPSMDTIAKVAKGLGLDIRDLFGPNK